MELVCGTKHYMISFPGKVTFGVTVCQLDRVFRCRGLALFCVSATFWVTDFLL